MRYLFILLVMLCTSCGTALPTIQPYKLDVQQGNVVTSKMLLQLRPGMTKSQVRFIMGTPLIQDSFHGNRWDYVYQLREGGKITEQRRVILDFENELLKAVRGDVVPSGSDQSKAGEADTGTRVVKPYVKPAEKSLMNKLKFWEKDEAALAKEAAEAKAKKDADEAAEKAALLAKENAMTKENAVPAAEVKSILAVPVEVLPAPHELAAEGPVPPTPVAPVVKSSEVELVPVESMPTQSKPVEKAAELTQGSAPTMPPAYESPAGMKFDGTLRIAPEEVEPMVKSEVAAPRAGNKTVPKPKDLPAEGAPGFFDRMLEKIGF